MHEGGELCQHDLVGINLVLPETVLGAYWQMRKGHQDHIGRDGCSLRVGLVLRL